ncbi:Epidermis-specific secreted EP1-like glycoprotein [Quillaja saponaria]|uniref:Epidermis-specific secreted EP1-like glycoprotein n=1 Tax=Quillaja saponaria TaxID=32244 RepID=A0AAD7KZF8_QUISA|nr:Epidermis-specific secreted EP1-like glycoprotein [Quillaja saponaria]
MDSTKISVFTFIFLSFSASMFAQAVVPQNETFTIVNEGEIGPFIVEYDGSYRALSVFNAPFQLAFYNTTPNAYTLALRMGLTRSESLFRWVWEANRGNPVGENATFSFGTDGNLVLADADGRIAWQTNTANKGVVAFRLLSNGNMVLLDSKGKFVWQSFDHPTDTLLVGLVFKT